MKKFTIITSAVLLLLMCGCSEKSADENNAKPRYTDDNGKVVQEVIQPCIDYFDGLSNNDAEKLILATTPLSFVEGFKEKGSYDTIFSEMQDILIAETIKSWTETYGANPQITFVEEISNTPLSAEQLDSAELCYKYNYYDIKTELNFTDGFEITYKYKIQGADNSTETEETACFLRGENDNWKMLSLTANALAQYSNAENSQIFNSAE